jgi:hypothetical protein
MAEQPTDAQPLCQIGRSLFIAGNSPMLTLSAARLFTFGAVKRFNDRLRSSPAPGVL